MTDNEASQYELGTSDLMWMIHYRAEQLQAAMQEKNWDLAEKLYHRILKKLRQVAAHKSEKVRELIEAFIAKECPPVLRAIQCHDAAGFIEAWRVFLTATNRNHHQAGINYVHYEPAPVSGSLTLVAPPN